MKNQITILVLGALALILLAACAAADTDTNDNNTPTPTGVPTMQPTQPTPPTPEETAVPPTPAPTETTPTPPTATSTPTLRPPDPLPGMIGSTLDEYFFLIPSLDRQIFTSDVIVLAEFVSATAAVKTIPGKPNQQPTYRPAMTLTFTATEYLKGSGPNTFSVELWDKTGWNEEYLENGQRYAGYLTEAKALAEAQALVAARTTTYDDRPGVMFLNGPVAAASGSGARSGGGNFDLALFNAPVQGSFAVDVDSMSRAWLPSQPATGARDGDAAAAKNPTIVTNRPPPDSALEPSTDPNTMQFSALKTRITEIAAMITAGDGTKVYSDCLYNKLTRHEWYRGKTFPGRTGEWEIASGAAAGTELLKSAKISGSAYNVYSTSGADAAHFSETIVDDDTIASNSYYTITAPTRPLPAGAYTANFHLQHHRNLICGFNPTHSNYTTYNVTVTAPYGTLHEAFFDPVTVGTAVKADGSNGVLKPTSFTVGSTATDLTSLEWASNQVVLTLNPHVSLSGQVLDFIELDGSVSLSLSASDATVDSTSGTHSWSVTTEPWEDGDQLMLRIREAGSDATLSGLTLRRITIAFDAATTEYTADVANNIRRTTVTATTNDEGATAVVKLGGVVDADGTVALEEGSSVITVEVTAEDGTTTQTYTITVNKAAAPLTASFSGVPPFYNGSNAFTFRIAFSEAISTRAQTMREEALQVTGGEVTRARRVAGQRDLWEITVQPQPLGGVTIVLPVTTDCTASGAVCTGDNRPLSNQVKTKLGPRTSGGR